LPWTSTDGESRPWNDARIQKRVAQTDGFRSEVTITFRPSTVGGFDGGLEQ